MPNAIYLCAPLFALLLSGCDQQAEPAAADQSSSPAPTSTVSSPVETDSGECRSEILPRLSNTGFEVVEGQFNPTDWYIAQHAGERTYVVTINDGVITIDNTGKQIWMQVSQRLPADDLVGRELEFSAEIKMELHADGWQQVLTPGGGLTVQVRGIPPTGGGRRQLMREALTNQPLLGEHDWHPVGIRFTLPEGATQFEVGFLHQAFGSMSVRKPQLQLYTSDGAPCPQD